jgi:hypothetical protein
LDVAARRVLVPADARESMSDGGRVGVASMAAAAADGVDTCFGRGERAMQQLFDGTVKEEPGRTNPTM